MRIIVDAMGGDTGPEEAARGAVDAGRDMGVEVVLVGDEHLLKEHVTGAHGVTLLHAPETIGPGDQPVAAIRRKRESSMVMSLEMLSRGEADAMVSAGNTGALLAGGLMMLGRAPHVDRPAIAVTIPTAGGEPLVVLDMGANSEVKPRNLLQFGFMGSLYAESVLGRQNPRVALLNIGAEPSKGTDTCKAAYDLLRNSPLNFIGNVEARDMFEGHVDVVVCDGFVGNVLLKFAEGIGLLFLKVIKEEITRGSFETLAAVVLKPAFERARKRMDYTSYGGAPLLGLAQVCVKCHGSSNSVAFKNSVRVAVELSRSRAIATLGQRLDGLENGMESGKGRS